MIVEMKIVQTAHLTNVYWTNFTNQHLPSTFILLDCRDGMQIEKLLDFAIFPKYLLRFYIMGKFYMAWPLLNQCKILFSFKILSDLKSRISKTFKDIVSYLNLKLKSEISKARLSAFDSDKHFRKLITTSKLHRLSRFGGNICVK